jgi:flagellar biosynthesis protein FlhG
LPAIAVTGGKGGVGKTCVAVNLAVQLGLLGLRPLLVDCDLGLANADALLGVNPTRTLAEVILANADPTSAVIDTPAGIPLLPAASGVDELTGLNPTRLRGLVAELGRLARNYDLLVLDTAAGIGSEVTLLVAAARLVLVVITPEPTSLTDAYALIKLVESRHPGRDFRIVVNQAESPDEAARTFGRLQTVAKGFLGRDLGYLGHLPRDLDVRASIRRRRPFALTSGSPAGQALRSVAIRLKGEGWVRSG